MDHGWSYPLMPDYYDVDNTKDTHTPKRPTSEGPKPTGYSRPGKDGSASQDVDELADQLEVMSLQGQPGHGAAGIQASGGAGGTDGSDSDGKYTSIPYMDTPLRPLRVDTACKNAWNKVDIEIKWSSDGEQRTCNYQVEHGGENIMKPCIIQFAMSSEEGKKAFGEYGLNVTSNKTKKVSLEISKEMRKDEKEVIDYVKDILHNDIFYKYTSKMILFDTRAYKNLLLGKGGISKFDSHGHVGLYTPKRGNEERPIYLVGKWENVKECLKKIEYLEVEKMDICTIDSSRWPILEGLKFKKQLKIAQIHVYIQDINDEANLFGTRKAVKNAREEILLYVSTLKDKEVIFSDPRCRHLLVENGKVNEIMQAYFNGKKVKEMPYYVDIATDGKCVVYSQYKVALDDMVKWIGESVGFQSCTLNAKLSVKKLFESWIERNKLKIIKTEGDRVDYVCTIEAILEISGSWCLYETIGLSDIVKQYFETHGKKSLKQLQTKHHLDALELRDSPNRLEICGGKERIDAFKIDYQSLFALDFVSLRANSSVIMAVEKSMHAIADKTQCCFSLKYRECKEQAVGDCKKIATWQQLHGSGKLCLVEGDGFSLGVNSLILLINDDSVPLSCVDQKAVHALLERCKDEKDPKTGRFFKDVQVKDDKTTKLVYFLVIKPTLSKKKLQADLREVARQIQQGGKSVAMVTSTNNEDFTTMDMTELFLQVWHDIPDGNFYISTNESDTQHVADIIENCLHTSKKMPHGCFREIHYKEVILKEDFHKLEVRVKTGSLLDTKADVLVNTVNPSLDFGNGKVSQLFLQEANAEIRDLQNTFPDGLEYGDHATTRPGSLKRNGVKKIVHCVLPRFNKWKFASRIKVMIRKCLLEADVDRYKSIAFPAFGTGGLGYPVRETARAMFDAVEEYQYQAINSSLKEVCFVVYGQDKLVSEGFKSEEEKRQKKKMMGDVKDFPVDGIVKGLPCLLGTIGEKRQVVLHVVEKKFVNDFASQIVQLFMTATKSSGAGCKQSGELMYSLRVGTEEDMKGNMKATLVPFLQLCEMQKMLDVVIYPIPDCDEMSAVDQILTIVEVVQENIKSLKLYLRNIFISLICPEDMKAAEEKLVRRGKWETFKDSMSSVATAFLGTSDTSVFWQKAGKTDELIEITLIGGWDQDVKTVRTALDDVLHKAKQDNSDNMMDDDCSRETNVDEIPDSSGNSTYTPEQQELQTESSECMMYTVTATINNGIVTYLNRHQKFDDWKRKATQAFNVKFIIGNATQGEMVYGEFNCIQNFEKYLDNFFPNDPLEARKQMDKAMKLFQTPALPNHKQTGQWKIGNLDIVVAVGDITTCEVDCIVSSATFGLTGTSGVEKAIANKAGPAFKEACNEQIKRHGYLTEGECRATTSGSLQNCKKILHVAAPITVLKNGVTDQDRLLTLKDGIFNCLETADAFGFKSIAFPVVGSGRSGIPTKLCAQQYIRALAEFERKSMKIYFIAFQDDVAKDIDSIFKGGITPQVWSFKSSSIKIGKMLHLNLNQGNVLSVKSADVLVSIEDHKFSGNGDIASHLHGLGSQEYKEAYTKLAARTHQMTDVIIQEWKQRSNLPFKYILHAVAPRWNGDQDTKQVEKDITDTVHNVLKEVSKRNCQRVAMPVFGESVDENRFPMPVRRCCSAMIEGFRKAAGDSSVRGLVIMLMVNLKHALIFQDLIKGKGIQHVQKSQVTQV